MGIKKIDIDKEFNRIDGKQGIYMMALAHGHNVVYYNGEWGMYWRKESIMDQHPEWLNKEECLEKAYRYLVGINDLETGINDDSYRIGYYFDGFEKYDSEPWK